MSLGLRPGRVAGEAFALRIPGRNDKEESLIVLGEVKDYRKIYAEAGVFVFLKLSICTLE